MAAPTRTVLLLTLVALVAGCGEPSPELKNVGTKLGETWDAMKTYAAAKKDEAVAYFQGSMEGMEEHMQAWKEKAAEVGGDASVALDAGWSEVQQKFEAMKDASGDAWESSRDAFVEAYEAFTKKVEAVTGD